MTNYAAMSKRIRACKSREDFTRIEKSLERVYIAGLITANELSRLDGLMIDRIIELDV